MRFRRHVTGSCATRGVLLSCRILVRSNKETMGDM